MPYARFWVLQLLHLQRQRLRQNGGGGSGDGGGGGDDGSDGAEALVPAADMALLWLAHISMSGAYRVTCRHFGPKSGGSGCGGGGGEVGSSGVGDGGDGARTMMMAGPWGYLRLCGGDRVRAYARTKRLYEATYGAYGTGGQRAGCVSA
ncbi:hypothetical protein PLESTB_000669300 [Pleodorina starrii]|uniref:Uncharacterized protein n=1 Tax=Pleodorina starrii TaxID=330485 RepID=A0A9W6BIL7_9CHLO|nr:hypothetical protein PLESTM_001670100 [Pleodorina starrii]GLC52794.1 hypothetical protein PLESTB_000669300 [Pleodorina starrii]GLC65859.1 hypothetical protein PLESTF_000351200 [Pleodorina starrii]